MPSYARRVNSPFPWPGGKRNLKNQLLELIPKHDLYVEVFCGSAKLLFAKDPSACEVINDRNGDVANFFRVVKHRAAELAEMFDHEIVHAGRFRELRGSGAPADELQRALRFAYLVWYSYGAKSMHFASSSAKDKLGAKHGMRRPLDSVRAILEATAARLRRVLIEQRDFSEILARYDSKKTWFYLDPPYVHFGNISQYEPLAAERREQLFDQLAALQAKWLMSFDDCSEVRRLAKRHSFEVCKVGVSYSLGNAEGSRTRRGEVLISRN
jgi:DNA adenine methylase